MKIAIIDRIKDNKRIEIRNLNEKEFLSRFDVIGAKDVYNGFKASSNGVEYYITILEDK